MPTASRLVSAVLLALLAYAVSEMVKPLLPEGTDFGWFSLYNAAVGATSGWIVLGNRLGRGVVPAINSGLSGVATMVFWCLFSHSAHEMFRLALRRRFDGPVEAFVAIFQIGMDYAVTVFTAPIIGALLIGAIFAGLAGERASRIWR